MRWSSGVLQRSLVAAGALHALLLGGGWAENAAAQPSADTARIVRVEIPGSIASLEFVPVPGGTLTLETSRGEQEIRVQPFLLGRTEVTWELYELFTHGHGPSSSPEADAVARPSDPAYHQPDYGWGRGARPVISVSRAAAEAFCDWLSAVTGRRYRLPTEAEWVHAARLAAGGSSIEAERLDELAWHAGNANAKTQPVGTRAADALGAFDLFGNVAEWVIPVDAAPVIRGGSFHDPPEQVGPGARASQEPSWTERDPQLPRSAWWLTDAPFVGFRVVRDP